MSKVVETLRGLTAEASILTQAAVDGRLDTRGCADNFQGGYRDIVQGMNDVIGSLVGHCLHAGASDDH